ncbi:MAG: electron transport complex subunit RsxC [Prevotellaceae bacterium]|jgi:electron transport complex protein RnfC|nr:electron transport complex subunit RsxC [Prevotellaceae bacterium]
MIKTFKKGGVHPPENKISRNAALEQLVPEGIIQIFISQHIGAPAECIVAKGDKVKVGQLIAKANGFVSANVHSSVSGTVLGIENVADYQGIKKPAICIQVEGDEWDENIDRSPEINRDLSKTSEEILAKITEAGLVGLGGATFPTHVKLSIPKGKTAKAIIINGAECEPYLTSDHRVMLEKGEELLIGVQLLKKVVNVDKAYIGIETNKQDAIDNLKKLAANYSGIEIVSLKPKYPQGGEKQLIKSITGLEVPDRALPIETGCIVSNICTTLAVYEAVQKNKPLFENSVTITGKNLNVQKNFIVRVGTPLTQLINAIGGMPENTGKVISGGPMMGRAINNLNAPTLKGSGAVLFITKEESKRGTKSNCIRCSKCVAACPIGLLPFLLYKLAERNMLEDLKENSVHACIECGCCLYTCPANLPLVDYIRLGKTRAMKLIVKQK